MSIFSQLTKHGDPNNLVKIADNLKGLTDRALVEMQQSPTSFAPAYMIDAELQRRKKLRDSGQVMAGHGGSTNVRADLNRAFKEKYSGLSSLPGLEKAEGGVIPEYYQGRSVSLEDVQKRIEEKKARGETPSSADYLELERLTKMAGVQAVGKRMEEDANKRAIGAFDIPSLDNLPEPKNRFEELMQGLRRGLRKVGDVVPDPIRDQAKQRAEEIERKQIVDKNRQNPIIQKLEQVGGSKAEEDAGKGPPMVTESMVDKKPEAKPIGIQTVTGEGTQKQTGQAGTQGGIQGGIGAYAQQQSQSPLMKEYELAQKAYETAASGKDSALGRAIMAGGFGLAAGKNLGEAGQAGLQTYIGEKKARQKQLADLSKAKLDAARFAETADITRQDLAIKAADLSRKQFADQMKNLIDQGKFNQKEREIFSDALVDLQKDPRFAGMSLGMLKQTVSNVLYNTPLSSEELVEAAKDKGFFKRMMEKFMPKQTTE